MNQPEAIETTVYHIGAAGGVHRSWEHYPAPLRYVCFDAEEGAAAELDRIAGASGSAGRVRMFIETRPVFERGGQVDFHVYDEPMLSSVYPLDEQMTHRFKYANVKRIKTVKLQCTTVDEVAQARAEQLHALTIDAQGAGLAILKGARQALADSVVGVRIEVEFLPLYVKQPLFDEVWSYMRGCGFRLVRLEKCGSGETGLSTDAGPFGVSIGDGVPAWADAIFLKAPADPDGQPADRLGGLLFRYVLFAIYNGIGSVGLDLIMDWGRRGVLERALAALGSADRSLLLGQVRDHLDKCERSTWETQQARVAVFRRERAALRAMLDKLSPVPA